MAMLKNLPVDKPKAMKELIDIRKKQVVSMALSKSDSIQMSVFSFADEEMVSEEAYFGDTMYMILEGETKVELGNESFTMKEGDTFMVPSKTLHAIGGIGPFKMLQITIKEEQ